MANQVAVVENGFHDLRHGQADERAVEGQTDFVDRLRRVGNGHAIAEQDVFPAQAEGAEAAVECQAVRAACRAVADHFNIDLAAGVRAGEGQATRRDAAREVAEGLVTDRQRTCRGDRHSLNRHGRQGEGGATD
ncbi:MAG: hypothetical protein ABT12_00430 [Paludibacter sp. SCN 51-9]|nr:MAG: hypothetical protein ABT12_00430 [Paludibacter sp. SCN 51-9]